MRVFVTGATGFIGSALVPELRDAGHQVVGLARSEESARALEAAGAEVRPGSLDDPDSLRAGAADADGVVHLAYVHDFSQMAEAAATDRAAIAAMADALDGTGRPLLIASGVLGLNAGREPGHVATEEDTPPEGVHPRSRAAELTIGLAGRDIRSCVVRLAPTVHGAGDAGFIAVQIAVAREKGVSGYVGTGSNRWSAVHRLDAARAVRLALEKAAAGSVVHAIAEEGVPTRTIAEAVGRHLDLPVVSVAPQDAAEHFGWLGMMLALDASASSKRTRALLSWEPVQPGLVADLDAGHYFDPVDART